MKIVGGWKPGGFNRRGFGLMGDLNNHTFKPKIPYTIGGNDRLAARSFDIDQN